MNPSPCACLSPARARLSPLQLSEVYPGTAELNEMYYRLAAGCVPFKMTEGEPFFYLAITSPDSKGAADSIGGSTQHPNEKIVGQHIWFRLFVNLEDAEPPVDTANCDMGCGWGTDLVNGVVSTPSACANFASPPSPGLLPTLLTEGPAGALKSLLTDDSPVSPTKDDNLCVAGTETLAPPSCKRNVTARCPFEVQDFSIETGTPRMYGYKGLQPDDAVCE